MNPINNITSASPSDFFSKIKELIQSVNYFIKSKRVQVLNYSSNVTWDLSGGYNSSLTLSGNSTLNITSLEVGDYGTIRLIQDATGSRTLTLPVGSKVSGGGSGALTLSTAANSIDIATFYYNGINLYWNLSTNFN